MKRDLSKFLKQLFYLQPKNPPEQSSKRHFWNVHNVVLESFCFAQETKSVFISIRYRKTSQTQYVKSQSTERSVREKNRSQIVTLQLNTKHVLFQVERPQEVLKTYFLVTTKEKSKAELEQIFLERTQRHFAKLMFSFRWDRLVFFGRFVRKSSKQMHTFQNDEDHVSEKKQKLFLSKYSVSQDISNAGCKEPKYRT